MLASQIIYTTYPILRLEDKVTFALQLMDDYDVMHLPVKSEDRFMGMVSKSDLFDIDEFAAIGELQDFFVNKFVNHSEHLLKVLKTASDNNLSLVPIIDNEFKIIGCISMPEILNAINNYLGNEEPGGIVVVEVERRNFSIGELSRLVETNDAQIIQLNTTIEPKSGLIIVTFKINKIEISDIISTLQRYDYSIRHFFGEEQYNNELRENYDNLLAFLKV